jgi:hypothetical protein
MRTALHWGSVLLLASLGIECRSSSSAASSPASTNPEPWSDGTCETHHCETFAPRNLGESPHIVKDAVVEFSDYGKLCRTEVSWRVGERPGLFFQATVDVRRGQVVPLPGGLVSLHYCQPMTQALDGHWTPPLAGLVLDPEPSPSVPPLAPGNVFIPLGGEARLDGDLYTRARYLPRGDAGEPPSVTIFYHSPWFQNRTPHGTEGESSGLHDGDGFVWGRTQATVVRIVGPTPGVDGWVEVGLSLPTGPARGGT